jgi:hypothetical protein
VVNLAAANDTMEIATLTTDPDLPVSFWYASERALEPHAVQDEAQLEAER